MNLPRNRAHLVFRELGRGVGETQELLELFPGNRSWPLSHAVAEWLRGPLSVAE